MLKPITTSVYTFRNLVEGGYLYVDKTRILHELAAAPQGIYFFARPRRFGKSLTLSTFEEIFLGNRALFQGLAIHDLPFAWKVYPVIRIDLGDKQVSTAADLRTVLCIAVKENADRYGVRLETPFPHTQFRELILALGQRERVVVLIDEYDKPILGNLENGNEVAEIRDVLKAFYSVIKSADRCLRFAFLTGVSKFSRVSVFSDLNNLQDLTMDARCAALCGYTQDELETSFAAHLERVASQRAGSVREVLDAVRNWYNGYRFTDAEVTVHNPVSVGRFLDSGKLSNYWFETGTPSFLIKLLKKRDFDIRNLARLRLDDLGFAVYDVDDLSPEPLLFQTGYLTIKEYDSESGLYTLGYPNREVENAFLRYLIDGFTATRKERAASHLVDLRRALTQGDLDGLFRHLRVFFADIPYDIQLTDERYYQTVFYLVFRIIGLDIDCEVRTEAGRIDVVVRTRSTIFLFEFKLHGSAEEALALICTKRYFEKYLGDPREVRLVGAAFDPGTRNLERWVTGTPP